MKWYSFSLFVLPLVEWCYVLVHIKLCHRKWCDLTHYKLNSNWGNLVIDYWLSDSWIFPFLQVNARNAVFQSIHVVRKCFKSVCFCADSLSGVSFAPHLRLLTFLFMLAFVLICLLLLSYSLFVCVFICEHCFFTLSLSVLHSALPGLVSFVPTLLLFLSTSHPCILLSCML